MKLSCLSLLLLATMNCALAQQPRSKSLSMIKTSDGKTYYGYWLDQNEREVALVDIVNNDVVTLGK